MGKWQHTDRHHKKPRSLGGKSEPRNLITVDIGKHRAFHLLFRNWTPEKIAIELNRWIDPDYEMVAVKKTDPEDWDGQGGA